LPVFSGAVAAVQQPAPCACLAAHLQAGLRARPDPPCPALPAQAEIAAEKDGYRATRHQSFVGTGYFDELAQTVTRGRASTAALTGSTEEEQF
jgi:hypothetical protein